MKHWFIISLMLLLVGLFSSPLYAQSFGAPLSLKETTSISTILEDPDSFVGKTLQVKGLVVNVCASRGCWMSIAGERPFEQLRFKVEDGEMVFPMTARGKIATVEGVLQKFVLSKEDVIAYQLRHAQQTGESFDPATVTSGETYFQLRGLGAVIENL
jgi:hypothetical protein